MASLQEIETHWGLKDVFDALDYLDFVEDAQAFYEQEASKKK